MFCCELHLGITSTLRSLDFIFSDFFLSVVSVCFPFFPFFRAATDPGFTAEQPCTSVICHMLAPDEASAPLPAQPPRADPPLAEASALRRLRTDVRLHRSGRPSVAPAAPGASATMHARHSMHPPKSPPKRKQGPGLIFASAAAGWGVAEILFWIFF